jgi:hypothetical protein
MNNVKGNTTNLVFDIVGTVRWNRTNKIYATIAGSGNALQPVSLYQNEQGRTSRHPAL